MPNSEELLALMRRDGVPPTRENYLHLTISGDRGNPWTAEHESRLPD